MSVSLIFFSLSILGLFRFPDVYTRLHSSNLSTTFGFLFFVLAVMFYILVFNKISPSLLAHIIFITLFFLTIEPCIAHAISRAARKNGIKPEKAIIDKLNNL